MFSVVNKNNHDDMDHSMSNPSLDAIATASVAIPHNEFNDIQKNDDDDDEMDSSSTSSSSSTFVDDPCWGSPTECSLTYLLKQIKQEECILYESNDYIALNKPADLRMDGDYPATVHKLLTYWYPPPSVLSEFELYQKQQLQVQKQQLQVQQLQLQEGKDNATVESKDNNNNMKNNNNDNVEPVFVPFTKMNKDNDDHHQDNDDDHDNDMLLFSRFIETRYHKHSDHIDNELRPCHQLDYATSGVLLVARSRKSANYARQLLQGRNVQKVYLARIHGCLKVPSSSSLSSSSTYNTNPDTRVVMGSNSGSSDRDGGTGHKEWPMFSSLGHVQRLWKKMEVSHRRQRQRYHKGDTFKGYLPPSSLFQHWKAQERRREQQHKQQIIRKEEEEATTMNQPTIDDTTMEVQQQQQQQQDDDDDEQQQPSKKKKARYNNQQESSSSKSLFNPRLSHEQWTHVWDQLYKTSKKGNDDDMRKKEEEDDKCRRHMKEDNDVEDDVDTDNDTFLVTTDMKWKQVKQQGQAHHFQRAADVYNQYLRQHQVLLQQEKEEGFETEENNENNNRADLSLIASTSSTGLPLLFRIQSDNDKSNNNNHDNDNSTKHEQQQQEKKDDGNEMDGNNHNKNHDIQQLLKPNENTFFICASIAEIPNQFAMTLHPEETKSLLKPYSHLLPLYTLKKKKKKKKTKKKILQQEQQQKQNKKQKGQKQQQEAKSKKDNNNAVVVVDDDDDDDESQPLGVPLLAREEEEEELLLYKPCLTQCTIMEYNPQNATTKVLLIPWSGRRHQLRIHMALLGHAIVGDPTYRRKKRNRNFPRMYLHAYRLFVPSSSSLLLNKKNKNNNNKNQKYNKNNKNTTNYNKNKYDDDDNNKNKNEKKKESIMGSNIEEEDPWQTLDLQAPDPFV